nr:methyl-accepting chemotaxis protein [Paludibacterium yongneupense]
MLANLRSNYRAEVKLASLTFSLSANPVFDGQGERLGSVVEWFDRTEEVRIEAEVGDIVGAAASGVFEQRISLEDKQGFFRTLGEKVNQLLNVTRQGLTDIADVLGALAQGDLTRHIENDYQGLFGTLKTDTNATVDNLRDIVRHIQESTEQITGAAGEISSGNSNLSQRTEEQAASLEETASSMEEITSTVRQNADNAKQANRLAIGASDTAGRGGKVVSQVVTTMTEINDSSRKIVDIISVIDGIAFQTNILALNAAVEAARAGEQGRGFAVVASEVRNLAQRSAAAAKEIKSLIGDSVDKVESGAKLVDEAGRTMEEIVASIAQVAGIMSDISAASGEQSAGIEQISQAVTNMDENTQKNAALVEEAAAAAESLEEQAQQLSAAVSRFRLEAAAARAARATSSAVARSAAAPRMHSSAPLAAVKPPLARAPRGKPGTGNEWEEF